MGIVTATMELSEWPGLGIHSNWCIPTNKRGHLKQSTIFHMDSVNKSMSSLLKFWVSEQRAVYEYEGYSIKTCRGMTEFFLNPTPEQF